MPKNVTFWKTICRKQFLKQFVNDKKYQKVRDHYHFTGKYRGAVGLMKLL